jgi:hypothetical protein
MRTEWRCGVAGTKCFKCARKTQDHTFDDFVGCAYRGRACLSCGHPPHQDSQWGCVTYNHPDDTARDHELRETNPRPTFLSATFDDPLADRPGYLAVVELYNNYVSGKHQSPGSLLEGRQ